MKILIFGASGKTGHELVKQALAKGHLVTAFVRNPSKLDVKNDKLIVYQGDITQYHLVEQAAKGQEAIFSTLGASSPFTFDQSVVDGMGHILKAMETHGVKRLIYMSFIGVKESRHTAGFIIKYIAPKLLATEIAGHEAREKMITASQLQWTIVRPATLTNGKQKGNIRSGTDAVSNGFSATISRADAADFMLQQLTDSLHFRKTPGIMY